MTLETLKESSTIGARRLISLEVNPPRGVSPDAVFKRLDGRLSGIDFLNVTDSALARMRQSPFAFASVLKQRLGIELLVNLSCRDRNLIAIQGDLLGAWMTGIRSIVALTGDAVSVGDSPDRKGVFEVNSVGLLNVVNTLNSGFDLAGNKLTGAPDFLCGVVVNPNARNQSAELRKLQRKREAGARYAISQPVFDGQSACAFFEQAQDLDLPIFMSLLPLSSVKAANSVERIPGMRLSEELDRLIKDRSPEYDLREYSLELCLKLARDAAGFVCGFHVISGTTPKLALKLAGALVEQFRPS